MPQLYRVPAVLISGDAVTTYPPPNRSWLRLLTIGRNPRLTLIRAACLAVVALLIFKFVLLPIRVIGGSMEPTYHERGVNVVNTWSYLRSNPQRGDVVGIRFSGRKRMLLKRIVGLPGELIGFRDGRVTLNGEKLDEPYVKFPSDWNRDPVELGPDEYFAVGDNRSMPMETHYFGKAKREKILGKVML